MNSFTGLGRNRFFEVLGAMTAENRSDEKVCFMNELDMSSAQKLRMEMGAHDGVKPSYTALVVRAVALALSRHPCANRLPFRSFFWKRLVQLNRVDVAVAVEKDEPGFEQVAYAEILRDVAAKDVAQIAHELKTIVRTESENSPTWRFFRRMVERLPSRLVVWLMSLPRFSPTMWVKYRGGAVLISSPSKYGVDAVLGHWVWPLGFSFGLVKERPTVVNGKLCVRPTMTLTMSFNRLVMGGAPAARFFHEVTRILENAHTELRTQSLPPIENRIATTVCMKKSSAS